MVFLVVQPRKVGDKKVITKEDARGTSTVASDSDIIISLNRELLEPDDKDYGNDTGIYGNNVIASIESRFGVGGYVEYEFKNGVKFIEKEEWSD